MSLEGEYKDEHGRRPVGRRARGDSRLREQDRRADGELEKREYVGVADGHGRDTHGPVQDDYIARGGLTIPPDCVHKPATRIPIGGRLGVEAPVDLEARVARYNELHEANEHFVERLLGGTMSFVPRGNRVLVSCIEAPDHKDVERPDGSTVRIEYPDNAKPSMRASRGVVLALGPGRMLDNGMREPMGISIGDFVQFGRFAGQRMDVPQEELKVVGGKKLIILTIDEIHGAWHEIAVE